jgi:hypothetical protein
MVRAWTPILAPAWPFMDLPRLDVLSPWLPAPHVGRGGLRAQRGEHWICGASRTLPARTETARARERLKGTLRKKGSLFGIFSRVSSRAGRSAGPTGLAIWSRQVARDWLGGWTRGWTGRGRREGDEWATSGLLLAFPGHHWEIRRRASEGVY